MQPYHVSFSTRDIQDFEDGAAHARVLLREAARLGLTPVMATGSDRHPSPSRKETPMPVATEQRYEDYTPDAMARLRSQGNAGSQLCAHLRRDWLSRGSPAIRPDASSVPPLASFAEELPVDSPLYEGFLPDALCELRAQGPVGEAMYRGMRCSWEDRGKPAIRADASRVPPAVDKSCKEFIARHLGAVDPSKKYEDYTATEMGRLRQSGEISPATFAEWRNDWIHRGSPMVKSV